MRHVSHKDDLRLVMYTMTYSRNPEIDALIGSFLKEFISEGDIFVFGFPINNIICLATNDPCNLFMRACHMRTIMCHFNMFWPT